MGSPRGLTAILLLTLLSAVGMSAQPAERHVLVTMRGLGPQDVGVEADLVQRAVAEVAAVEVAVIVERQTVGREGELAVPAVDLGDAARIGAGRRVDVSGDVLSLQRGRTVDESSLQAAQVDIIGGEAARVCAGGSYA